MSAGPVVTWLVDVGWMSNGPLAGQGLELTLIQIYAVSPYRKKNKDSLVDATFLNSPAMSQTVPNEPKLTLLTGEYFQVRNPRSRNAFIR